MSGNIWTGLKRTIAPSATPITLIDLSAWLRLDLPAESGLLEQLIQDVVDYIEGPNGIGIALMPQTWEMQLDGFPACCIEIPLTPVRRIESIAYVDTEGGSQVLDEFQADVVSQPAKILPAYGASWPPTRCLLNAVTVTFTAGYDPVPGDLRRAVMLLAAHWFEHRTASTEPIYQIPFGVDHILDKYRVGRF